MRSRSLARALMLTCAALSFSAPAEAAKKFWVGGGLGLGFGDVRYADLSAVVGYRISERWSTGVRLTFRGRSDDRSGEKITTNDYGASVFGRYRVYGPLFLHGEYEYLSYEYIRPDLGTERDNFSSVLGGAGIGHPIGKNVSMFASLLYNFSYDSSALRSPYDNPLIIRVGFGFHF